MRYFPKDPTQRLIIIAVSSLLLLGLVMVTSTTFIPAGENYGDNYFFIKKQLIFIAVGILAFLSVRFIKIKNLERLVPVIVLFSILLLFITLIPGLGIKIYGARRWLRLPFIRFQTSELAKIASILFLANYYNKHDDTSFWESFVKPVILIMFLILPVVLEPDYSTSVLIFILTLGIMLAANVRLKILSLVTLSVSPFIIGAIALSPYRLKRFLAFLDPWKDPARSGFQIIQSYIAIYMGGFWGVGLGNSKEKLFYLPEAHNDFILSILAEELGFVGVLVVFVFFSMIFYSSVRIAIRSEDKFRSLVAFGIGLLLFLQFMFNVGVIIGFFPVTGIPLPFISYGGTSLIISMFLLGVLYELSREL